jgi:hypothetical protein
MDELSKAQRDWLNSGPIIAPTLSVKSDVNSTFEYEVLDRDSDGRVHKLTNRHGAKGFVLRVRDRVTHTEYAAKLAVPGDYENGRFEQELSYAQKLRPAGTLFICPTVAGFCTPPLGMPEAEKDLVCFVTPWVEGCTLKEWLESADVEPDFACAIAVSVLTAITFLERVHLKHDDLHSANVMIAQIAPELALFDGDENKLEVSIIDLGSLKPACQPTRKSRDDRLSLLQILTDLHNALHKNRKAASSHPRFMRQLNQFIEKLADDDISRHFPSDKDIARELADIRGGLALSAEAPENERRFHPFEAISAEHLADDSLLLNLFVNTLPWMQDVQESKPIVLTGPRGCGKSMIFRYLSVRTHLGRTTAHGAPERPFDSFGVYISCATHLQNNLSWLGRKSGRAAQRAHEISTYFQLVVVRELLKALGYAHADVRANQTFRFDEAGFDQLIEHISKYFRFTVESPRLANRSRLLHFAESIDAIRVKLHRTLLQEAPWPEPLPDTFLSDITAYLPSVLPYFETHQLIFLLDDYSTNRVQKEIQEILTKIVFERVPTHIFKISCEKFGFHDRDIDGVRMDDTREYVTIDAGQAVLSNTTDENSRGFVESLINRRLETAKWKGSALGLLGNSTPYDDDEVLVKHIKESGGDRSAYYYGLHVLGRLWSGDTATVLQIVREIFVKAVATAETTSTISRRTQHDAIVSISKAFQKRVDGYHPYGALMSNILGQFGVVLRDVIVKGSETKRKPIPYRLYRLEMTKQDARPTTRLLRERNEDQAALACELLRRAIFVELADSRGKEGPATHTMRWELRRIFNPAFGLSLSRDGYLNIKDLDELQTFLTDPATFAERIRVSYAVNKKSSIETRDLFGADDDK